MKSQKEMIFLLMQGNHNHYQKTGIYSYEIAQTEQEVITSHSGKIETKNTAFPGDYILTDTEGGKYAVKPETFAKRYEILDEKTAKAKGQCWAMQWEDETTVFASPWKEGETITINPGDYLASPNAEFTEAYRIIKEEFEASYTLVNKAVRYIT